MRCRQLAFVVATLIALPTVAAACAAEPEPDALPASSVSIEVSRVVAEADQTSVYLRMTGEPVEGRFASPYGGRAELVDPGGAVHYMRSNAPGETSGERVWVFPAIGGGPGELILRIPGLNTYERPVDPATVPTMIAIKGPWEVRYRWDGRQVASQTFDLAGAEHALGPGKLVVERVTVSDAAIVLEGHMQGFAMEEVPELQIFPPSLTLADGRSLQMETGGYGWGERRERFSVRFVPGADAAGATFTVPFRVSEHPHDVAAAESLRARGGPDAVIVLDLP